MDKSPFNGLSVELSLSLDYSGMTDSLKELFDSLLDDGEIIDKCEFDSTIETFLTIYRHSGGIKNFSLELCAYNDDGDVTLERSFEPELSPEEAEFYFRKACEQVISNYHSY